MVEKFLEANWYMKIAYIVGIIVFIITYLLAIVSGGFLGLALGWIPAGFAGAFFGILWPMTLLIIIWIYNQIAH